jgi:Flp pilus assembly protein TadD
MQRVLLTLIATVLALPALAAAPERQPDQGSPPVGIGRLIADLGSDQYAVRRRAEDQLLQLGPEAFDELKQAEGNPDLEIAERVRYIVQRMRVEWIHADDEPEVRRALARYGDLSDAEKRERLRALADLPAGGGLAALARIARFEPSPLVARRAALAILSEECSAADLRARAAVCRQELGNSSRAPAHWIALRLDEVEAAPEAAPAWDAAVRAETALLADKSAETEFSIVRELVSRHLDRCHDLKLTAETSSALAASIALIEQQLDRRNDRQMRQESRDALMELVRWGVDYNERDPKVASLAWAMAWIIRHEEWNVLAKVRRQYAHELTHSRKLLYHLAAAESKAGHADQSTKLAERAFQLKADDDEQRIELAEAVAELGFVDWAEREYRRAIDDVYPVLDRHSLDARNNLAMWLHDREDYRGAADLLGEFCTAVAEDPAGKKQLLKQLNSSGDEAVANISARRQFYLACDEEAKGRIAKQREHLEQAIKLYNKDADILIAMHRLKGADEQFRRQTAELVRATTAYYQQLIDEYPDVPSFYNQWAWLVANTEGDKAKAVEYSRRSLELAPNEASYLDTLGRCYFAVGDLENAVKYQSRAVQRAPQYHVMKRQLKVFQEALAAKSK